jgi:hypothetical protein
VRCSTRCFVLQRFVGSVAERFRSGAAAAAKEDGGLVGEVVVVSVGVDDSGGPLDQVGPLSVGVILTMVTGSSS